MGCKQFSTSNKLCQGVLLLSLWIKFKQNNSFIVACDVVIDLRLLFNKKEEKLHT